MARTTDGLNWHKHPEPHRARRRMRWRHGIGARVIDLDDGGSRLFYEACDDHENYRILSATSF